VVPGKRGISNEVGRCKSIFLVCWPVRGTLPRSLSGEHCAADTGVFRVHVGTRNKMSGKPPSVGANPSAKFGFGIPTPEFGNNVGTLRVPLRSFTCLCVPSPLPRCLRFQIKVLCHGRGRGFESRRTLQSTEQWTRELREGKQIGRLTSVTIPLA
jgi:hypothetical protein